MRPIALAVEQHLALGQRLYAIDGAQEARPPRTVQSVDAENLAGMDLEIDAVEAVAAQPAHFKDDPVAGSVGRGGRALRGLRIAGGDGFVIVADNRLDNLLRRHRPGVAAQHHLAIGQANNVVGDGVDLVELVVDEENTHPPVLDQAANDVEQLVDLFAFERGRRFVEQKISGVAIDGTHDLEKLALRNRQPRDEIGGRGGNVVLGQQFVGAPVHFPAVEEQATELLRTQKQVLGDGQFIHQAEFLVDAGNACGSRSARRLEMHRPPVDGNRSFVRHFGAGKRSQQSRLAGTVVTDQSNHLPGQDFKADVGQCPRGAVPLGDA